MQDKKWLQEAMQSFTVDEGKRMRELLDVLRDQTAAVDRPTDVDAVEAAFDELLILIETIDNSRGAPPAVRQSTLRARSTSCSRFMQQSPSSSLLPPDQTL